VGDDHLLEQDEGAEIERVHDQKPDNYFYVVGRRPIMQVIARDVR
jgi:hypothetical protein